MPRRIKTFDLPGAGEVEIYAEFEDEDDPDIRTQLCVAFEPHYPEGWWDLDRFVIAKLAWASDPGYDAGDRFSIYVDEVKSNYAEELEATLLAYAKKQQEE